MSTSARFPAFGSTAQVIVSEPDHLPEAVTATERVVAAFDRACSRFRADSELTGLATGRPVRVSPLLFEAIEAGVRAARLTDGDVDPTLGAALVALGYDRDFALGLAGRGVDAPSGAAATPAAGPAVAFATVPGWQALRLDRAAGTVTVPKGVIVDLGATAKALAADHAAEAAHAATGGGVLVGFGGDLSAAGDPPEGGWLVRVTDDHRAGPEAPGQTITIEGGGLATSSTTTRRWETGGEERHHLIDPRTLRPVTSPWRTVSVAAACCLDANIASAAAIIRGQRAIAWLEEQRLPARLVEPDGAVHHVAGWPATGEDSPAGLAVAVAG